MNNYYQPDFAPLRDNGSWTVSAICKQNCVFPHPLSPEISVMPFLNRPPPKSLSICLQPVVSTWLFGS